jgi:plastocyanin
VRRSSLKLSSRWAVVVTAALLCVAGCEVIAAPQPSAFLAVRSRPGDELAFDPAHLYAPRDSVVRVTFSNASSVEHNLVFVEPLAGRTREIVLPGEEDVVDLRTSGPGSYRFVCTVHVGMEGTLTVD